MKKKSAFRIKNVWQAVVFGAFWGLISVIITLCLLAGLLVKFDIPSEYVKYLWLVPAIISGFISGGITGKYVKSKSFLWGSVASLADGIACLLMLLAVNSLNIEMLTLLLIPVFLLTGSIGGIISSNLK